MGRRRMAWSRFSVGFQIPLGIWRVLHQEAVVIPGAVGPPHGSAFAECDLGGVDGGAGLRQLRVVFVAQCSADVAPCGHQGVDEFGFGFGTQSRVRRAPQAMANDQVAAIRGEEWIQRSLVGWAWAHHRQVVVVIVSKDEVARVRPKAAPGERGVSV